MKRMKPILAFIATLLTTLVATGRRIAISFREVAFPAPQLGFVPIDGKSPQRSRFERLATITNPFTYADSGHPGTPATSATTHIQMFDGRSRAPARIRPLADGNLNAGDTHNNTTGGAGLLTAA